MAFFDGSSGSPPRFRLQLSKEDNHEAEPGEQAPHLSAAGADCSHLQQGRHRQRHERRLGRCLRLYEGITDSGQEPQDGGEPFGTAGLHPQHRRCGASGGGGLFWHRLRPQGVRQGCPCWARLQQEPSGGRTGHRCLSPDPGVPPGEL